MGSSVRYNRTLEPYLRSRGRENEVINDFCLAPFQNVYLNYVGELAFQATQSRTARRDRNFRLAIPSLIVNNHRPGFSSAQLLIRHGSHSLIYAQPLYRLSVDFHGFEHVFEGPLFVGLVHVVGSSWQHSTEGNTVMHCSSKSGTTGDLWSSGSITCRHPLRFELACYPLERIVEQHSQSERI